MMRRNSSRWGIAAGAVTTLLLAGCAGEQAAPADAPQGTAEAVEIGDTWTGSDVTVELWHDNAAIQPAVDLFNEKHADQGIQIEFTETTDLNTAVRNASSAGDAPDLFVTQTADLASFISEGIAADITAYYPSIADDYSEVVNDAVTTGERQWAVPAAAIPTFMLYNAEVFEANGVEYPTTYEEFLEAGKVLREKGIYAFNVAGEDPTTFIYMAWEAGARWYTLEGEAWRVNVDDEATRRAAEYFDEAFANDLFSKISYAEYAAMMQQYDQGKIAARQLSTWQTKGMQANLKDGLGAWDPQPNLQWEGNEPANAAFTRVFAVNAEAEDTAAAVFAAHALSSDADTVAALSNPETGLAWFPALPDPQPYVADALPADLVGEHADNWEPAVMDAVETQKGQWTYGPNWAGAFAHLQDLWGKAVAGEIATTEIAPQLQEWIVADLKQQGIAVVED
jgi:multiple sugar transport system substrate-binding protein